MRRLSDIFFIESGNGFSLNKMDQGNAEILFVSRTAKNNGVSAKVKRVEQVEPFEAGLITVALSGNGVLHSCVQPYDFYTGFHVAVLVPKSDMTIQEKLYYCQCIRSNRYKYSYGRQANRTLGSLMLPAEVPEEFKTIPLGDISEIAGNIIDVTYPLNISEWMDFELEDLFVVEPGRGALLKVAGQNPGPIPMVTATRFNNGISLYTSLEPTHRGNTISLVKNGNNVGKAFYQPNPFISTSDMAVLIPKFEMDVYIAMFLITVIEREKYRYNYGRKWGVRHMKDTKLKLPTLDGKPNWNFMRSFIQSLKYSVTI